MIPQQSAGRGAATGDYGGNHGDTSPGLTGASTDYYFPGNGTGLINTCRGICDAEGNFTGRWMDKVSFKDVHDGTTNTLLAGELHIPVDQFNLAPMNGAIFEGRELESHTRVAGPGAPILSDKQQTGAIFGFGSSHPLAANFVFADGSTRALATSTDTVLLGKLAHRHDGGMPPGR